MTELQRCGRDLSIQKPRTRCFRPFDFYCRTHFTPKDKDNAGVIPTGKIVPVQGTAFDFSSAKAIGKDFAQLKGGYDHNFVLFGNDSNVKDIQLSRAKQRSAAKVRVHFCPSCLIQQAHLCESDCFGRGSHGHCIASEASIVIVLHRL